MTNLVLQTAVNGIATGALVALVAVGLSLVFRISRFINVAHVDIATIGAYGTLLVASMVPMPFPLAALAGVALATVAGFLTWRLVYRRLRGARSITLIITSIGVALILRYLVMFIWGGNQFAYDLPLLRAIRVGGIGITPYDLTSILIALALFGALHLVLRCTRFGRELRAVADNPDLARVAGIRSERVVARMWLIASALAGTGGVLLAVKTVLTPYLGWNLLIPAFAAMIFGGVGSVTGTLVGALAIGIVSEFAAMYWVPTYRLAAVFAVIVIVLVVRPQGLFGTASVTR